MSGNVILISIQVVTLAVSTATLYVMYNGAQKLKDMQREVEDVRDKTKETVKETLRKVLDTLE